MMSFYDRNTWRWIFDNDVFPLSASVYWPSELATHEGFEEIITSHDTIKACNEHIIKILEEIDIQKEYLHLTPYYGWGLTRVQFLGKQDFFTAKMILHYQF